MIISYNWLHHYLPERIDPERLSYILTSVGLEVEKMEHYEEVRGGLQGLIIGEVILAEQHPNADKLKLTKVDIGSEEILQIVCGAPNVAVGQKVVVATVGSTIYPEGREPLTMKVARIRGVESQGMICAEDEIGLGQSHEGILVLPAEAQVGSPAADYFKPYSDSIYEIGLTPNRMDAMSHWGVARDVCAFLSHHGHKKVIPILPVIDWKPINHSLEMRVNIENQEGCKRYSGVCITAVQIGPSPIWLQQIIKSIGIRPINNIVDITNFIQHETGQPLHAFDYDAIHGRQVIVKTLPEGTSFVTLDSKTRKLSKSDLMICNDIEPMCLAGVFGGLQSGVTEKTTRIFLESACFDPVFIRKTSFRHQLRTDAATRFEKGIDISNTVRVLKRAAIMIQEITGGIIASELIDIFPKPQPKKQVVLEMDYLQKLSGKKYDLESVKKILTSLGFTMASEITDSVTWEVPFHKIDVSLPADLVEEILRIDGLDNIEIPTTIRMSPSIGENNKGERLKEKISNVLTGLGFTEILTNSITNSAYLQEKDSKTAVRLMNNLSVELDVMRPTMIPTALEVLAFNINRKNTDLKFFEFGKTYAVDTYGKYLEQHHLCLYMTGLVSESHWKLKSIVLDHFYMKGITTVLLSNMGFSDFITEDVFSTEIPSLQKVSYNQVKLLEFGQVAPSVVTRFNIKQPVFFADFFWNEVLQEAPDQVKFKDISKYPPVQRDLALVVDSQMKYSRIRELILQLKIAQLREIKLFDIFVSEKLGAGKKSLAINLTFIDEEKTLTDKEIESWMNKIMIILEKELDAEIRK